MNDYVLVLIYRLSMQVSTTPRSPSEMKVVYKIRRSFQSTFQEGSS